MVMDFIRRSHPARQASDSESDDGKEVSPPQSPKERNATIVRCFFRSKCHMQQILDPGNRPPTASSGTRVSLAEVMGIDCGGFDFATSCGRSMIFLNGGRGKKQTTITEYHSLFLWTKKKQCKTSKIPKSLDQRKQRPSTNLEAMETRVTKGVVVM
ncbi:uncharacterized protein BDR25DRAFT_17370 [Lindgomyces ingoldianus]|uniref:Uncharacterized protein n=1 Tax=Lindgomyces ingoldianus TaxID=673940 RepID=A0ACB6QZ10_9PLEO|nr:uncharacterized protein BDR25DRAFT_17370 [Lindgomyces ingoldianus]KAF2472022.1 hypothetical protein BDR25DRAFT_17370 [Lindgomyces ingoldianus]